MAELAIRRWSGASWSEEAGGLRDALAGALREAVASAITTKPRVTS